MKGKSGKKATTVQHYWITFFISIFFIACPATQAKTPFHHVPLKAPVSEFPDAIKRFKAQSLELEKAGAFHAQTGSTKAKAWFLAHIDPSFICERDFGGGCNHDTYLERINSFLFKTGEGRLYGAGLVHNRPDSFLSRGLHTVGLDLSAMRGPFDVSEHDPNEYCRAELVPISWPGLAAAHQNIIEDTSLTIDDELGAADRLKGILGTWNVRAAPSIKAKVVARVQNEAALFPEHTHTPDLLLESSHLWWQVKLSSGQSGFIAAKEADLLHQLNPRICLRLETSGMVSISRYIGGGD